MDYKFKYASRFYDYKFKGVEYQNSWRCILNNTFKNMELYYRKQSSMRALLSSFRKAFHIAPITLKNSVNDTTYKYKLLAIYLLTKYSKEDFTVIATEFNINVDTVNLIYSNTTYQTVFQDDIKLFFKQFEDEYLGSRKQSLVQEETIELDYQDSLMSKKIQCKKLQLKV